MSDAERRARCAWLALLTNTLDGDSNPHDVDRTATTYAALSEQERPEHLAWRQRVGRAVEATIQRFCPGGDPECCDQRFWPLGSDAAEVA